MRLSAQPRVLRLRRRLPTREGEREWLLELEIDVPHLDPEQLLNECQDFVVDGRDGRQIGVVDSVERSASTGAPTALLIAAGWFGRRRLRVDVDAVETLIPAERRLIVDESQVHPADHDGRRA